VWVTALSRSTDSRAPIQGLTAGRDSQTRADRSIPLEMMGEAFMKGLSSDIRGR